MEIFMLFINLIIIDGGGDVFFRTWLLQAAEKV